MIEAPRPENARTAARAIAESLAQATPVTAGLARLYQFTHPSEFEQQLEQWRQDVSRAINEIYEQIRPRLVISEASLETARALVENLATKGYDDSITFERIADSLPDFDRETIKQACFDLSDLGFLSIEGAVGKSILNVRPDTLLFQTFDPYFRGANPVTDAVEIARTLIEQQNSISAHDLETSLGWCRRRFNPAFAIVVKNLEPGWLRQPLQPKYPATSVRVAPEVRARLQRFIANNA